MPKAHSTAIYCYFLGIPISPCHTTHSSGPGGTLGDFDFGSRIRLFLISPVRVLSRLAAGSVTIKAAVKMSDASPPPLIAPSLPGALSRLSSLVSLVIVLPVIFSNLKTDFRVQHRPPCMRPSYRPRYVMISAASWQTILLPWQIAAKSIHPGLHLHASTSSRPWSLILVTMSKSSRRYFVDQTVAPLWLASANYP